MTATLETNQKHLNWSDGADCGENFGTTLYAEKSGSFYLSTPRHKLTTDHLTCSVDSKGFISSHLIR